MSRRWFGGGRRWPFPMGGSTEAGTSGSAPSRPPHMWSPRKGKGAAPHRPTLASSLVAALLAVGVVLGFVVARDTGPSIPSGQRGLPTTSAPVPSTSTPSLSTGTTTTSPTTTAPHAVVTTTSPSGPGPCTPSQVVVTTTTDGSSYPSGATVTVTTLLRAVQACVFQPVAVGPYSCADTVVITDAGGAQQWPWPGQSEQCSPPAPTVLEPGVTESLRAAWNGWVYGGGNEHPAPNGVYQAIGTWAWSAGSGRAPYQVSTRSQPFTVTTS